MSADWLAEDAYNAFTAACAGFKVEPGNNEATTRQRIIHTILFDVLKWPSDAVTPETHVKNVGYIDYEFGPKPACHMILEAKREGTAFVLKDHPFAEDPVPFGLLGKEFPDAAAALTQAQGYANQRGARYSAITNGHQWLLSMTFVPNLSVEERLVYVFESFDAIQKKFRTFFNCFSSTGIRANVPSVKLLETRRAPAPKKLSGNIAGYPVTATRNTLATTLHGVLQLVWDGVDADQDNETFLRNCYIPGQATDDMFRVARELLQQRASTDSRLAAADVQPARGKKMIEQQDRADQEQPVVILGRIGHGKSTYLKYLRHVEAKDLLHSKYIQIDLNFIKRPNKAADVPDYVMNEVERQLKDVYQIKFGSNAFARQVLKQQLKEFQESARGILLAGKPDQLADAEVAFIESFQKDRDRYMSMVMKHIRRGHNKSVAIFFDNLDRRDDDLQEQAFLLAAAMAAEWGAMIFICLRPGSVQRSRAYGVLDTLNQRVIVIPQPDTSVVLRKRFQYASKFALRQLPQDAYVKAPFSEDVENQLPAAGEFFDMCDRSIHRSPGLADQYDAVANGNIRNVVEYVRRTLVSNHLATDKIMDKLKFSGEYYLAEHETLRALMYGPYVHYEPNTSLFTNLFDIRHADPTEHFSRVLLLDYCHRHANSVDKYGFIPLATVHDYMNRLGYSLGHVTEVVDVLYAKDCIEGKNEGRDLEGATPVLGDEIRITNLGSYHMSTLVNRFVYLDAVVVDTPILDDHVRTDIRDVHDNIRKRLDRAREFLRYLDRQAEILLDTDARKVWEEISERAAADITDVETNAKARGK